MEKKVFYTELCYLLALPILAIGTALMERADFGMSMVVAPVYLLHLVISPALPFFSFGMAEYLLQLVLLVAMALILRRAKLSYLLSFVTAVLYGFTLDAGIALVGLIPGGGMVQRILFYLVGMLFCCIAIALFFKTYIPTEAYELFVKELSGKTGMPITRFKTIYDIASCVLAIAMSFIFFGFGHFEGVKLGTILCALVNGWGIGICSKALERMFEFRDGLKLRRVFQ